MNLWPKTLITAGVIAMATGPSMQAALAVRENQDPVKLEGKMESTMQVRNKAPLVEAYLLQGKLAQGEVALRERLKTEVGDDQARFGLGVLQFLRSVENLGQSFYRFGIRTYSGGGFVLPFLRLPAPTNEKADQISYEQLRSIISQLLTNLTECQCTLSQIKDGEVQLPLHFGMIQLDLSGKKDATADKSLWKVYAALTNHQDIPLEKAQGFYIKFDRGDVHWLRGYCHLLSAICCIYLAHDSKELFQRTAHLFFTNVQTPYGFLNKGKHVKKLGSDGVEILDLIALVHLIRCEVVEAPKMTTTNGCPIPDKPQ